MGQASNRALHVTPQCCIGMALVLLAVPLPWAVAWMMAAAWHELCHLGALRLCRRPVGEITIGFTGAKIRTGPLTDWETLFCSLAGPGGGLLLLLLSRYFPRLAVCALLQSAGNLIPLYPLDGGHALHSLCRLLLPDQWAERVTKGMEDLMICGGVVLLTAAAVCFQMGLLPLLLGALFLARRGKIKFPCKWRAGRVQ